MIPNIRTDRSGQTVKTRPFHLQLLGTLFYPMGLTIWLSGGGGGEGGRPGFLSKKIFWFLIFKKKIKWLKRGTKKIIWPQK